MSLINTQVQPFKNQAFHNGKFIEVTEATLTYVAVDESRQPRVVSAPRN